MGPDLYSLFPEFVFSDVPSSDIEDRMYDCKTLKISSQLSSVIPIYWAIAFFRLTIIATLPMTIIQESMIHSNITKCKFERPFTNSPTLFVLPTVFSLKSAYPAIPID